MKRTARTLLKTGLIGLIGSIVFALLPLALTIIAGLIASANGCQLDESGNNVCMFGSFDAGGILATVGLFGWFSLMTIPIGIVVGVVALLVFLTGLGMRLWNHE